MTLQRILLVEDSPADEKLTLRALRRVNLAHQVDVVRDGQQAVDYVFAEGEYAESRAGAPPPVVILLDMNLPKLGGLEVLRRVRTDARTRLVPVVMLTSSDEERDRLSSYQGGANSFVRKPVVFEEFAETVGRLGVYWVLVNSQA